MTYYRGVKYEIIIHRYLGSEGSLGERTYLRPWDDGSYSMHNYKRRLHAAFDFFQKINVKYYSVSNLRFQKIAINRVKEKGTEIVHLIQLKNLIQNKCNRLHDIKYSFEN